MSVELDGANNIVKTDTISEVTSANGVTVDGLSIKDGKLVTADSVIEANMSANSVDSDSYVDGSIDTAHIADGQITIGKLATAVLTGATDIGADIVDADLLLVDDGAGGTLRKTAASRIKTYIGDNTPAFEALLSSSTSQLTNDTDTALVFDTEIYDSDGTYDTSNGRFTPAVAGKYFIYGRVSFDDTNTADTEEHMCKLYKNGSQHSVFYMMSAIDDSIISYTEVVDLDADDYVQIYAKINNSNGGRLIRGADATQKYTTFGAFRITGV